jgi:hypothetical protein
MSSRELELPTYASDVSFERLYVAANGLLDFLPLHPAGPARLQVPTYFLGLPRLHLSVEEQQQVFVGDVRRTKQRLPVGPA